MADNPQTTPLSELADKVITAALRWADADVYVHPVLSREQAVKVGVADLLDAVQNYRNALPPAQARNEQP